MLRHVCGRVLRSLHTTTVLKEMQVKMPSLSPTMETGTIVKWLKKEGEQITSGDVLCEIQTDKAVVSMEMDEDGTLAKIVIPENTPDIKVGALIAMVAEEGEDWKSIKIPEGSEVPSEPALSTETPSPKPSPPKTPETGGHISKMMGPAVKLLLEQHHIDSKSVVGTGPHGQLLKGDVLAYVSKSKSAPAPTPIETPKVVPEMTPMPSGQYTDIPLSNMRKTIAKRLTESKATLPHAYSTIGVDMSKVLEIRKQLKADKVAVTVNDFIVKSVAMALRSVPEVNVQYVNDNIRLQGNVDVCVAVATESGLITPIVFNADILGITDISLKVKELVEKAKTGTLQLQEFQGGTFTVSNLGMYGISEFTAIINPPQAAILAIGGSHSELNENMQIIPKMVVSLCFDNRAVCESDAARFLEAFRDGLEDPDMMLMGGIRPHPLETDDETLLQLL